MELKNIRAVVVFSVCGFLLSFIFGFLFSHSPLTRVFLIALLFALVFAFLALAISFVWNSMLQVDGASFVSSSAHSPKTGSKVDLVVSDEDLPEGQSSHAFSVGDNRQLLHEGDYSKSGESEKSVKEENTFSGEQVLDIDSLDGSEASPLLVKETKDAAFVPIELGKSNELENFQKDEIKKDETLDDLPDLGASIMRSSSDDDGAGETEFSSKGVVKPRNKAQEQMNDKDTVLIAKAISTVLAKDKE